MPGSSTSVAEITHVSKQGMWLWLDGEELFAPFSLFPWFQHATIGQLSDVHWPTTDHLFWPQLDVDLSVSSIRSPDGFPLIARPTP